MGNDMEKNVDQRKQLKAFADRMEQILTKNDDKGGWEDCSPSWLMGRAGDELREARRAYARFLKTSVGDSEAGNAAMKKWQDELVDIANFCMMAWDRLDEEIKSAPVPKAR